MIYQSSAKLFVGLNQPYDDKAMQLEDENEENFLKEK